jgi:hypothetical protein
MGSGSSDTDNDELTYSWSLTAWPAGSSAVLNDPATISPCFIADLPGSYEVSLVVNDGTVDSEPSVAEAVAISYSDAINQLCPCEGPKGKTESWRSHGKYISCVTISAIDFRRHGLITRKEFKAVIKDAAKTSCGKQRRHRHHNSRK